MTTAAITLETQSRKVHEARRRLAVARGMWGTEEPGLLEMIDDAYAMLYAEEDTLRALAVAAFHATGQANVAPGITVTEDHESHRASAISPHPYGHFVVRVTLADDLGAALDAAGQAPTTETWR